MENKMKMTQWVKQYIKLRFSAFLTYLGAMGLFPCLDFLYQNNMEGVYYGMGLFTLYFGILGLFDFYKFYHKHNRLMESINSLTLDDMLLPESEDLLEEDYQAVIRKLYGQMRKAFRSTEERNDARNDYYTLWIHQIKTPISALKLLLQREKQNGHTVTDMEQELFSIEQYADMVLSYLRLDSISNDLDLRECDLNPIIKGLVKKYAVLFINRHISLELSHISTRVLTDEKWIELILEQILSNAVKYTRKGCVRIYMEEKRSALIIEDTGIGIRKEDIRRIFERGFTGFNGRMKEKSSGLGLFLAKEAAKKLGHTLEAESEPGQGSRFSIVFPKKRLFPFS